MFGVSGRLMVLSAMIMVGTACRSTPTALNNELAYMDERMSAPRPHLTYMVDNAMMSDMSIADFHFVVHTDELSSSGIERLDRMAVVLDTYGGTVRYETALTDEDMLDRRIQHVREYLVTNGCEMDRVKIEAGIAGGRGMPAVKATQAKERGEQASIIAAQQGAGSGSSLGGQ